MMSGISEDSVEPSTLSSLINHYKPDVVRIGTANTLELIFVLHLINLKHHL